MTTEVSLSAPADPDPSSASPASPKPQRSSAWGLLRLPAFRTYFVGCTVSNLGTWLQCTCQVVLAYQITRSVFAVGIVVCAQFAAIPLLSPWAAVIADSCGLKATLVASQVASALIAAAMAASYLLGMLTENTLILGAIGLGLMYSLALPLQVSVVPTLVPPEDAEAAVEMNSASYNSGRALAPALSVLIIATAGPEITFALNAASFLFFAIVLARLLPKGVGIPVEPGLTGTQPRQRARFTDGIVEALNKPRILLLLAIVAAVTLADDPILVLSPALSRTHLHLSADWTGYFIAALGWGAVIGSVRLRPRREVNARNASRRAACSLLVLGCSMVLFAVGISPVVSLVCALAAGAAALLTGVAAQTPIVVTDKKSAASVGALWAVAWAGTKPLASLADGALASRIGILFTAMVLAAPAMGLAIGELVIPQSGKRRIKEWAYAHLPRNSEKRQSQSSPANTDPGLVSAPEPAEPAWCES